MHSSARQPAQRADHHGSPATFEIMPDAAERLVKSSDRVRDLGEVFTPADTVGAMLDLLPEEMWAVHPSPTFLEPACGDGNFLVAILARKLHSIGDDAGPETLPAGTGPDAERFHALEALASIYAMDISCENVVGGTPGHEVGARQRLVERLDEWWVARHGATDEALLDCGRWVVERNVQVANMLAVDAHGKATGREDIPLVEYTWEPATGTVAVARTTLGQVESASEAEVTGLMTLFDSAEPNFVWSGPVTGLTDADVPAPKVPKGRARNGKG